ncbi:substrate-binding domain-containing protein [Huintestinicola sp.]|uniref:substrate-binding domain-containing protein n=1 Tax=Huintestinicola sp. TaxID=2981661 RepID=UPI003D7D8CF1
MSGEIFLGNMDKRRPLIAVIVSEADRSFICEALNVIQKELFAADMDAAVFSTLLTRYEELSIENKLFDIVNYDIIDGFIVFLKGLHGDGVRESLSAKLEKLDKPVIYMDEFVPGENNTVFDYIELADAAAAHLSDIHSVKTAAYVDGNDASEYYECLKNNFIAALKRKGITVPKELEFYGRELSGNFSEIVDKMISFGMPDAALCSSDHSAAALIGELSRRNVRVPEDIIIMGCCSGEPYKTSALNISSVKRDPAKIAANAARRIISAIKGVPFVPYEGASSKFVNGFSCGCGNIDLLSLSEAAKKEMMPYSPDGFDSCYNYMQEELISAPTFIDFLWKLDWYTFYINGLKGFWLCLNDNIMHTSAAVTEYTDDMDMPYARLNGKGSVDENRKFSRSQMLPYIFEDRDEPAAFIFTPLHFDYGNL